MLQLQTPNIEQQQLLSRADLKRIGIRVSNATLLRWEAQGRFPRRIRMAGTTVAWASDEVLYWYRNRLNDRTQHHYADTQK